MRLIVDAHVHLPVYEGLFSLEGKKEQLLQDMKKDRVDRCIVISDSELKSDIGSMEDCIRLFAAENAVRIVCGISPLIDFEAQLERLHRHITAKVTAGIKLFPGHEGFFLSDSRLQPIWHLAEETRIPVLFHSGWDNSVFASPEEVRKVLEAHPGLTLVCCHCFYPEIQECLRLTELPGLMFDLSSIADQPEITDRIIPCVRELICQIPDRVMFGSDYASCERRPHLQMMDRMELPEEIMQKVMSDNALSLYFR